MKLHNFDTLSFRAGLLMTFIGLAFLLLPEASDIIHFFTNAGSWIWPAVFLAAGVAILAPLAARAANRGESEETDV